MNGDWTRDNQELGSISSWDRPLPESREQPLDFGTLGSARRELGQQSFRLLGRTLAIAGTGQRQRQLEANFEEARID